MRTLILLSLAATCAGGQIRTPFTLSGTILDPTGASVPDATVELQRPTGHLLRSMQTDVGGTFRFAGLTGGNYAIRVQRGGFKEVSAQVRLPWNSTLPFTIRLELAEIYSEISAEV